MAVERRLTELVGPVGGKLHTARSRNDQVATDVALLVRAHSRAARALLLELMEGVVELAERHRDWPLPGYTHLQRAQPVYLAHHLLAWFWKFRRDLERFGFCLAATDELPLGAGALAGVNFETDRMWVARELGFGAHRPELARRGLQPRLRARLHQRRRHLRRPPVAARRGDRALVDRRVRLLPGVRRVRLGLEPHAPEEEPRRRRAAARQGAAHRRAAGRPARRAARPAAHLQQGPPGGQGAAVRHDRHARALPARGARAARRDRVRPRADGRRRLRRADRGHRPGRPAGAPGRALPGRARDDRRARARRARARQGAVGADRRGAGRAGAGAAARRLPGAARAELLARVEGVRRRHRGRARGRAARGRARQVLAEAAA